MTDTNLDPRSLTSEKRALPTMQEIHDATTLVLANPLLHKVFNWLAGVTARRAIFSEPAKVECPNCKREVPTFTYHKARNVAGGIPSGEWKGNGYTCQPAQPEPVAPRTCGICGEVGDHYIWWRSEGFTCAGHLHDEEPVAEEMPPEDEVKTVAHNVRECGSDEAAALILALALVKWRTHAAQPARVRMTEELKAVLCAAEERATLWRNASFNYPESDLADRILSNVAAVRAQAAEAGKG